MSLKRIYLAAFSVLAIVLASVITAKESTTRYTSKSTPEES